MSGHDPKPLILVIEDTETLSALMVAILNGTGLRAKAAKTAMEGVRLAREERPALILADVMLPDQDGATTMSCLHDNPEFHEVPIILVSSLPHEELVQKMNECGAVDLIQKPFAPLELLGRVKHWLATRPAAEPSGPELRVRQLTPETGELRIVGSISPSGLGGLEAAFRDLLGRGVTRVLVNLKETGSVFSAVIGCFLAARDSALKRGGDLVFVAVPPDLRKLFDMLGLTKILKLSEDDEAALAQFSK